jgi:putative ABC transport system permease protein
VAIINEAAARRVLSGEAVGRRVRLMLRGGPGPWLRVVGVVADVRHHGLGAPVAPEIYVPYAQAAVEAMAFVVRAATPPESLAGPVRAALKSIDPQLPVLESQQAAMAGLVDASLARPRLQAQFVNAFGAVALALAAIGIYGVVSYSVTRMRRDIGVRLALGAQRRDVLFMVLRTHMALVVGGVVIGLAGAAATVRFLESLLFGVEPTDPATFAVVTAILLVVGFVSAWIPARRATLVDPVTALRPE